MIGFLIQVSTFLSTEFCLNFETESNFIKFINKFKIINSTIDYQIFTLSITKHIKNVFQNLPIYHFLHKYYIPRHHDMNDFRQFCEEFVVHQGRIAIESNI